MTETWCSENISDAFLSIPDYELQDRLDREDTAGGRGGGLLVYSKKGIKILAQDKVKDFHQYSKFSVCGTFVYLIYRPPSGRVASMEALAELIRSVERNSVLIGDFNLPEIDWEAGTARGSARNVMEAAEDKLLEQLVDFSTHIRGNVLDLLLTNIPEQILEVEESGRLGHSDHSMILVTVAVKADARTKAATQPDWNKADWGKMREELATVDWRGQMGGKSGQEAWDLLKEKIHAAVEKHVPPGGQETKIALHGSHRIF